MPPVLAAIVRPLQLRCLADDAARKVSWLELFFDLAFVAAVAQVASPLATDYSTAGLLRFGFLFLLIWWAWSGQTTFATRFNADDGVQRGLTLLQMFAVAAMAVNATADLGSRDSAGFAAAYAAMRFVLVAQYVRAARLPASRRLTLLYARGIAVAAILWAISAVVPPPARFLLWGLALLIDMATPIVAERFGLHAPLDPEHLPERFGLFTLILFGEALVSVMKGMAAQETWSTGAAASAFLGLATIFALWSWYFDGAAGAAERPVRTARDVRRLQVWSFAHVPLFLGLALAGVGFEHLVTVAHEAHLHPGEVRLLGGALVLVMTAVVIVSGTRDDAPAGRARFGLPVALTLAAATLTGTGHWLPPAGTAAAFFALAALQAAWPFLSARAAAAPAVKH